MIKTRTWAAMLGIILLVFSVAALVAAALALFALAAALTELTAPAGWLFYEYSRTVETALVWLLMLPPVFVLSVLLKKSKIPWAQGLSWITELWSRLGRFRPLAVSLYALALYACLSSAAFVTKDSVVLRSPIDPRGKLYPYAAVERVETGFARFGRNNRRFPQFYYRIALDGKTVTFTCPSPNGRILRYQRDSYLELEEFDTALVSLGIPKTASNEGWESCELDKVYVDRFLRIIANAPDGTAGGRKAPDRLI